MRRSTRLKNVTRKERKWLSRKIGELIREEGYYPRQAAAIAYQMLREDRAERRR